MRACESYANAFLSGMVHRGAIRILSNRCYDSYNLLYFFLTLSKNSFNDHHYFQRLSGGVSLYKFPIIDVCDLEKGGKAGEVERGLRKRVVQDRVTKKGMGG